MSDKVEIQEIPGLKSIGEVLKKKREELSYTLEHVSEVTCITSSNLRNLEEGNLEELPGPVFVKGFIKNYARFLKIESGWMIESLSDDSLNNHASMDYNVAGSQFDSLKTRRKSNYKYVVAGIISIAFLLGLFWWKDNISSYFILDKETLETINAVETKTEDQDTVIKSAQDKNSGTEGDRTDEVQVKNSQANKVQSAADIKRAEERREADKQVISPLNLILVANESRWIRLTIDDAKPFDLLLKKGERYNWPAQENYFLIMSSGAIASIHLNGEEILDREKFMDQLYQTKLNKFTLKQINNR